MTGPHATPKNGEHHNNNNNGCLFVCCVSGLNTPRIIPQHERLAYCSRFAPQGPRSSDFDKLLFAEVTCMLGICLFLVPCCTLRDFSSLKCLLCSQLHSAFVGFMCVPYLYVSGPLDFRLVIQVLLSPHMILNACVRRLHPV